MTSLLEKQGIHDALHEVLSYGHKGTKESGASFTRTPPDLIRNKQEWEFGEIPLRQQYCDELRKQVLRREHALANELWEEIPVLKATEQSRKTHEELRSEVCIKALHLSEGTTSFAHIYMHGFPSSHRQRRSVGRDSMRPSRLSSDIPPVDPTGTPHFPHQPRSSATVASAALHGQNLWPAPTPPPHSTTNSSWGTDSPLESGQLPPDAPEEALLAHTPGVPPPGQKASERQSEVFETRTKIPLTYEEASLIIQLPHYTPTFYKHVPAHLPALKYPLVSICPSAPHPHNVILQAPCNLSIPWSLELRITNQDTRHGPLEYQPRGHEADLWGVS